MHLKWPRLESNEHITNVQGFFPWPASLNCTLVRAADAITITQTNRASVYQPMYVTCVAVCSMCVLVSGAPCVCCTHQTKIHNFYLLGMKKEKKAEAANNNGSAILIGTMLLSLVTRFIRGFVLTNRNVHENLCDDFWTYCVVNNRLVLNLVEKEV